MKVLFLSDTHLGVAVPARPRVIARGIPQRDDRGGATGGGAPSLRRPRGDDHFEAFERALAPALSGEARVVIHGGDLFYRSRIAAWLAERVFARLAELAEAGLDVFWVPGNHERSSVPRALFLTHDGIRVFDRPRTFVVEREGMRLAISGFPYAPLVRDTFPALVAATGHAEVEADTRLLCIHQSVEGATVGPVGFVFRGGEDVVRGRDVPGGFAAVLSGHIHRHQVLTRDLARRPLAAPVIYCGSTERTSTAERLEAKGAVLLDVAPGALSWEFREHPVPDFEHRVPRWRATSWRPSPSATRS